MPTPYYKVLLQYYKELLQYYKVLLHYYSVLQSTSPVLLRTKKYYSSTTSPSTAPVTKSGTWPSPSTAPVRRSDTWSSPSTAPATKSDTWPSPSTAPATQNDSHAWSSSHMNVISNARSNKCHPPNSPNTAPATQNDHPTSGRNLRKTAETSFPMRGRSENVPRMIRAWSETVPVSPQPATQQRLLFALRTGILYWKMQHFELRLSFQISPSTVPATKSDTWTSPSTAPTTQSDTWTSPSTAPATKSDTWPSPSTAPTTKSDTWPSPTTAPATQNDAQAWSSSHMKRHFQCEEQQMSPSKLTKYCAYHAKWHLNSAIYYAAILLSDSINWLYYYSAIYYSEILLIDSTSTQRSITQRFY